MASVLVSLEAHVTDSRTGAWCDRCNLPSAHELDIALCSPQTLAVLARFAATVCDDCGTVEHYRR